MDKGDFYNREGYADPTAFQAIRFTENRDLQDRACRLIRNLKTAIKESGFELINRIELRDRSSGREFR